MYHSAAEFVVKSQLPTNELVSLQFQFSFGRLSPKDVTKSETDCDWLIDNQPTKFRFTKFSDIIQNNSFYLNVSIMIFRQIHLMIKINQFSLLREYKLSSFVGKVIIPLAIVSNLAITPLFCIGFN